MQDLKFSDCLGIAGFALGIFNASYTVYKTYTENMRRKQDNVSRLRDQHINRVDDLRYFEDLRDASTTRWGYAKAFKNLDRDKYREADQRRQHLLHFWDDVCQRHQLGELPRGLLEPGSDWHMRAQYYSELMEPVDIANYCRLGFDRSSGPYNKPPPGKSKPNRPSHYTYLEEVTGMPNFLLSNYVDIWRELTS